MPSDDASEQSLILIDLARKMFGVWRFKSPTMMPLSSAKNVAYSVPSVVLLNEERSSSFLRRIKRRFSTTYSNPSDVNRITNVSAKVIRLPLLGAFDA